MNFKRPACLIGILTLAIVLTGCIVTPTPTPTVPTFVPEGAPTVEPLPTPTQDPVSTPTPQMARAASGISHKQYGAPPLMTIDVDKSYTATLITNKGNMVLKLFADEAPITVNNFVFLAREGFYNGVTFHRVIRNFMVQTGDPTGTGMGGPGYRFADEPVTRSYNRGIVAMANAGPNTNGSQFFIIHADYNLGPNYTIFGELTQGIETLDAIAGVEVGGPNSSSPLEPIIVESIEIRESP